MTRFPRGMTTRGRTMTRGRTATTTTRIPTTIRGTTPVMTARVRSTRAFSTASCRPMPAGFSAQATAGLGARRRSGGVWEPAQVEVGWRPYTRGRWVQSDYGWTWLSNEPWGWATYHYG